MQNNISLFINELELQCGFTLYPEQRNIIEEFVNGTYQRANIMTGKYGGKSFVETTLALYYAQFGNVTWIQPSKLNAEERTRSIERTFNKYINGKIVSMCPDKMILRHSNSCNRHANTTTIIHMPTSNITKIPSDQVLIIFEDFDDCRKSNSRIGVRKLFDQSVLYSVTGHTRLALFGIPDGADSDMIFVHSQWKDDPLYYSKILNTWEINPTISEDSIRTQCEFDKDLLDSFEVTRLFKENIDNDDNSTNNNTGSDTNDSNKTAG